MKKIILIFALIIGLTLMDNQYKNALQFISVYYQNHDDIHILNYATKSYTVFGSEYQSNDISHFDKTNADTSYMFKDTIYEE